MQEEFRKIEGYPGYLVSSNGYVTGLKGQVLKTNTRNKGYHSVGLGKRTNKKHRVHRLVAQAFIANPNPENYRLVRHLDGDKSNNRVENLAWGNDRMNMDDSLRHGIYGKLNFEKVEEIRRLLQQGVYQTEIAERFGVCQPLISDIKRGRIWKKLA